jgi:hypothetical protein
MKKAVGVAKIVVAANSELAQLWDGAGEPEALAEFVRCAKNRLAPQAHKIG